MKNLIKHKLVSNKAGFFNDSKRAGKELLNFMYNRSETLMQFEWLKFITLNRAKCFLQICHSEGAIIVRNPEFDT